MTAVTTNPTDAEAEVTEILAWARSHLHGPLDVAVVKERPWARTWRLSTCDGTSYLKAAGVASRYEAPLTSALHRIAPELTAPVLASRADTGWLLLADAGGTLDEHLGHRFEAGPWEQMLARFAQLQRVTEPLTTELLAAGVPDERPHRLFAVLQELLANSPRLAGLTAPERRALLAQSERWSGAAAELALLPVGASVQHGDLHPGNVALGSLGSGGSLGAGGQARFFDLGDASIAHPFTTLLVPLQVARRLGADDRQVDRLADSYLEVFTDLAPPAELRRGLDVALRSAVLPKAAAWDRALRVAPADHPWGQPVLEYLRDLL
jgi:hypothetical protein